SLWLILFLFFLEQVAEAVELARRHMLWISYQYTVHIAEGFADVQPFVIYRKFSDLFVMHGAAHFEDSESAFHLPISLYVAQKDNGIGYGGDMSLCYRSAAHQV